MDRKGRYPRSVVALAVLLACAPLCRAFTPTPDWSTESNQYGALYGFSVSTAGDVNGDGYSDVIVGAEGFDHGQNNEGSAFLYLGSASGLSTTATWTAEGNQDDAMLGHSVQTAGDVNGDGYSDVIVGTNGQTGEGKAYVFLGSPSGLATTPAWTVASNQATAAFGSAVATAGDVNGDGYADVLVGAYLYDDGETDEGRVDLYLGSASGLSTIPAWTAEGNQSSARFGVALGSAGDVNGDGYSDVVIGARSYDNGQTDEGRALVYLGSASGLSTTAAWTAEGDFANAFFGASVGTAGDVNGDGYSDVIVGAWQYDAPHGWALHGWAYVYFGSAAGLSTTAAWIVEGVRDNKLGFAVATAGDVNADGYSDVIVSVPSFSHPEDDEGRVNVYLGSASGLAPTPSWTAESDVPSAIFGWAVGSAGDVNGDGRSDVIVGAPFYVNGVYQEGGAFVYLAPLAEIPPALGGSVSGVSPRKVICRNRSTGGMVSGRLHEGAWDCEDRGLVVSSGNQVETSALGIATGAGSIRGSVTQMTPSSVFCQNLTSGLKVEIGTSARSWDCQALGLVVTAGDSIQTGASGTAD
jgi:hypothetical protein